MKKYLKLLLMALLVCGVMIPNVLVKADELESEEVSDNINIVEGTQSGDYWYEDLEDGKVVITRYTGSGGDVTIPSTLGGKTVTSIGMFAFQDCISLTAVTIPASVTSIELQAFYGCTNLVSVKLSSGLKSMGNNIFMGCSKLESIKIPSSVTSIGDNVFYACGSYFTILCSPTSYAATYAKNNYIFYAEKSMKDLKITLSETTCIYDGDYKEPKVTVKDGNKTLKDETEYVIFYEKNQAIGKATVTIVGIGNGIYGGKVTKTFNIIKGNYYNDEISGGDWNGKYYYLGGLKMTDIFFSDGRYTYYLQADGTAMKNRLTYHPDGIHLIYFDDKGHELFDKFQYCADVKYTCYFDTNGYLYKDVITFSNGKAYYLDGTGKMKQNEYFKFDNGVDLGYAQADGSLMNTGFGYDPFGNTVFYHWNGMIARGLITDGTWYYDMDLTDGHLVGKFAAN